MLKKFTYLSLLVSGLFVFTGIASAEQSLPEIKGVKGQVMLDDGTQYALAEEGQSVLPGTSVLVPAGGAGNLVFNDCTIKLKQNTVTIVPKNADCKGVVVKAYTDVAAPGVQASKSNLPSWLLPTAGIAAVAGVAAAVASSGGSSNKSDASSN
jgi:hypothetical protein